MVHQDTRKYYDTEFFDKEDDCHDSYGEDPFRDNLFLRDLFPDPVEVPLTKLVADHLGPSVDNATRNVYMILVGSMSDVSQDWLRDYLLEHEEQKCSDPGSDDSQDLPRRALTPQEVQELKPAVRYSLEQRLRCYAQSTDDLGEQGRLGNILRVLWAYKLPEKAALPPGYGRGSREFYQTRMLHITPATLIEKYRISDLMAFLVLDTYISLAGSTELALLHSFLSEHVVRIRTG